MKRTRRNVKRSSTTVKRRPYCPTCGYSRYVPAPPVVRNGITYTGNVQACPDCKEKPPVRLAPGQLPLDHQERAAGEKREP